MGNHECMMRASSKSRLPKGDNSQREPKVVLLIEAPNAYARGLLVGIGEYILTHGPWRVHFAEHGRNDSPPSWLASWNGQGIIARSENRRIAACVAELRIPTVDMTPSRLLVRAPWVKSDDAGVASLAAEHFMERGFRRFAFCGDNRFPVSERRAEYFFKHLRNHGFGCLNFVARGTRETGDAVTDAISRWLTGLPKPVAVFAYNDGRGQQVLDACRRAGFRVPEEVAVLGVDNDEVLCALSPPPMSSVILNPHRTGWEAAALLARMMRGERVPPSEHFVPPAGIATRQSTDILAVDDPQIARALRYIREHAREGIRVGDVLQHCPMSRRAMEMRFKQLLNRTPREEIARVRVNHVKELLAGTSLKLADISSRAGFEHTEYLSVVFKRETGMTIREFREKHGKASDRPHKKVF